MNRRTGKRDSHKAVLKVHFLQVEGMKYFQRSKSKAENFNLQHHRSFYWLTEALKQAFQAAKAMHDLEEYVELYTRSSYLSLWKNMC